MSGDSKNESTALTNEAKKKVTRKSSKQKQSQKQQMDLLKEQDENNKQFFANMIKGQQEIEREKDMKKIENSFLN